MTHGEGGTVRIVGVPGNLRAKSYDRAGLRAGTELLPIGATLETVELGDIPLNNQDLESTQPPVAVRLKDQLRRADAVLSAMPEYKYSIPGVLKNAIDWTSRPHEDNVWAGEPVGTMSDSIGMLGGARAQYDLGGCFVFVDLVPVNRSEVFVSFAPTEFDGELRLTDAPTREVIHQMLAKLVALVLRLNPGPPPA